MDREVIEQKLESLRRCLQRIQDKCPLSAETLVLDLDIQDIVALNLTRAIQVLVELGVISAELATRMKKAVGFRNIAVHNYEAINWQIAHTIATSHLSDFKDFAKAVIQKEGF